MCFEPLPEAAAACAACGASLADCSARGYRDKLIAALKHPLADVRMRVVHALGLRRDVQAAPALVDCAMAHPVDVVQGLLIVGALARIHAQDPATGALERIAAEHPSRPVAEAARRWLAEHPSPVTARGTLIRRALPHEPGDRTRGHHEPA
jgi:hypothetical protein